MDAIDFRTIGEAIKEGTSAAKRPDYMPTDQDGRRRRDIGECVAHELELAGYRIVKESELDKE